MLFYICIDSYTGIFDNPLFSFVKNFLQFQDNMKQFNILREKSNSTYNQALILVISLLILIYIRKKCLNIIKWISGQFGLQIMFLKSLLQHSIR